MKTLFIVINFAITMVVVMAFLTIITIADPIVKLASRFGRKQLVWKITCGTAYIVQQLLRGWGTKITYNLRKNSEPSCFDEPCFVEARFDEARFVENRPIVFVSSHHSSFDIILLINVLGKFLKNRDLKFISRAGLDRYIPLISFYLRQCCFSLPRRRALASVEDKQIAHARLTQFARTQASENGAVVIFPEGMKDVSASEHNARFRRNGLQILLQEMPDALLVPVVIKGTRDFYTTGRSLSQLFHQLPAFFTHIEISILPAVCGNSIDQRIDIAEERIASEYRRLRYQSERSRRVIHRAYRWIL